MQSSTFTVLTNPPAEAVAELLAQSGFEGLRAIEDYQGNVYVWPYDQATHLIAARMIGIPYDPAADYVDKLTGKTFYVRTFDDWLSRERRRSEPSSFTSRCRRVQPLDPQRLI